MRSSDAVLGITDPSILRLQCLKRLRCATASSAESRKRAIQWWRARHTPQRGTQLFANLCAWGGGDQRKLVAGLVQSFAGAFQLLFVLIDSHDRAAGAGEFRR